MSLVTHMVEIGRKEKVCRACAATMHLEAWKCPACQHSQGIRGHLSLLVPVLSLTVAFMALIPVVSPILFPPRGDLSITAQFDENKRLVLSLANSSAAHVIVQPEVQCFGMSGEDAQTTTELMVQAVDGQPTLVRPREKVTSAYNLVQMTDVQTYVHGDMNDNHSAIVKFLSAMDMEAILAFSCKFDYRDDIGPRGQKNDYSLEFYRDNFTKRLKLDLSRI